MAEFPGLRKSDDPVARTRAARDAVARLSSVVQPYEKALMEAESNRARLNAAKHQAEERQGTARRLTELKARYPGTLALEPNRGGSAFAPLLVDTFGACGVERQ